MTHPLFQIFFTFLLAFSALRLVERLSRPLVPILTGLAGLLALTIWLLQYDRRRAARLGGLAPIGEAWLGLVCRLTGQQVPQYDRPEAGPDGSAKLALRTDSDFREAAKRLKGVVKGYDPVIDAVLADITFAVQRRSRPAALPSERPLGIFLFIGSESLGKRYLADNLGVLLHSPDAVTHLDLADRTDNASSLVESARRRPHQTFVLDNLQAAPPEFVELLAAAAAGGTLRDSAGRPVSLRNSFLFLLARASAAPLAAAWPNRLHTRVVDELREVSAVPSRLLGELDDWFPFDLPDAPACAAVAVALMRYECEKSGLQLGKVDEEVIKRELDSIFREGGFGATPGRVRLHLKAAIKDALARGDRSVVVRAVAKATHPLR